jgi:hypothetical protein
MRQQAFPRLGRAAAALLCGAVLAVACDSPTQSDAPAVPARLDVVSGDLQTAEVGTELPQPLVVKVTSAKGKPVAGQIVNFRVVSGGGSVFAGTAQTNADGMAQERWTLGTVSRDTQRVEVRAVDPATGQPLVFGTFRAVGRAGPPAGISPVGSAARAGSAGAALGEALQARVTDRFGNPVPAAAVVWTVRSGGGSVTPGTATADSLGIAGAVWTLGPRLDSVQVVEAAATVAVKTAFTATAALPLGSAVVKVAGDGQTGSPGTQLAQPLKVAVRLPGGGPAVGATVNWSVGPGSGTITPLVSQTDANGEATAQWTLGLDTGAQSASASAAGAGTAAFAATAGYPPSITFFKPDANAAVGDSVVVQVRTSSSLVRATATIDDRTVQLTPGLASYFTGLLVLTGLPEGQKELVVRAYTAGGDSVVARRTVFLDHLPVLSAQSLEGAVARPGVRVDADCADTAGPCTTGVYVEQSPTPLASGSSGVHATLSLAAYESRAVVVRVRATDSRGQTVEWTYTVFVESSARWSEVAAAPEGRLWDFDAGRLLYVARAATEAPAYPPPSSADVRLRDRASGADTQLRRWFKGGYAFSWGYYRGFLHPQGAIFNADSDVPGVFDWRNGTLRQLDGSGPLVSKGSWALWWLMTLGNLADGSTVALIRYGNSNVGYDVAPNGDAVWSNDQSHEVFRYRAGTTTQLTNDDPLWNGGPVTDGVNVVFARGEPCCGSYNPYETVQKAYGAIVLYDGTGETVLGADSVGGYGPPHVGYEVNNGWTAYRKRDTPLAAVAQLWVRRPDGATVQATHAASTPSIAALGPNGELAYETGGRRYVIVAPYTGAPVDVGSAWTTTLAENRLEWRGGSLYAFLGRSAFLVSY